MRGGEQISGCQQLGMGAGGGWMWWWRGSTRDIFEVMGQVCTEEAEVTGNPDEQMVVPWHDELTYPNKTRVPLKEQSASCFLGLSSN